MKLQKDGLENNKTCVNVCNFFMYFTQFSEIEDFPIHRSVTVTDGMGGTRIHPEICGGLRATGRN